MKDFQTKSKDYKFFKKSYNLIMEFSEIPQLLTEKIRRRKIPKKETSLSRDSNLSQRGFFFEMRDTSKEIQAVANAVGQLTDKGGENSGTCFVLEDKNKYLVSALHCGNLKDKNALPDYKVIMPDGTEIQLSPASGEVTLQDPGLDLFVFKLNNPPDSLPSLKLEKTESMGKKYIKKSFCIGYPYTFLRQRPTVKGPVVSVGEFIHDPNLYDTEYYVTARIEGGNSGSPIIDGGTGGLLGMATSVVAKPSKEEGANFHLINSAYIVPAHQIYLNLLQQQESSSILL